MKLSSRITERIQEPGTVFLDTVRITPEERHSYLFSNPVEIITAFSPDDVEAVHEKIENALSEGRYVAGYWCYEWGYALIPKLRHLLDDSCGQFPLVWLGVYERPMLWVHDIGHNEKPSDICLQKTGGTRPAGLISQPELDTDRDEFIHAVNRIKDYIRRGDTYQVNYTVRSHFKVNSSPVQLYERLRALQEVSYGAVIHTPGRWILSLSPELFFHREGPTIWSKPMKGTVSRGKTPEEDRNLARFLKNDRKNRAENVMIVDLLRNDMGRLAETGTVRVPQLFHVEQYETLFQMISRIEATLKENTKWQTIFEALFPCGSITGAPKIRTMEIISEIESSPRGIYTGSIGFISPDSRAVLNVAIRTLEIEGQRGIMGTGSGITFSSDPEAEYEETRLKTRFLERAS